MDETLRLALVNHAILHGVGYDEAWPMVDEMVSDSAGEDVRTLADRVRIRASESAFPRLG